MNKSMSATANDKRQSYKTIQKLRSLDSLLTLEKAVNRSHDKSSFQPQKITFSKVIEILKKDKGLRTEYDINGLAGYLSENKFFKELKKEDKDNDEALRNCFKDLKYYYTTSGEIVILEGDLGYTYFIIIQGVVDVLINKEFTRSFNLVTLSKFIIEKNDVLVEDDNKAMMQKAVSDYDPEQPKASDLQENEYKYTQMLKVASLPSGVGFGELALMTSPRRNATIRANTDCHFAILNKPEFDRILKKRQHKVIEERIQLLNKYVFFNPITYHKKVKFAQLMEEISFQYNQKIYSEGDENDFIFFIKEGDFEVTKEIFVKKSTKEKQIGFRRMVVSKNDTFVNKYFDSQTQVFLSGDFDEMEKLKKKFKNSVKYDIRMSLVSCKDEFGLFELISNCPYRITTVTCKSMQSKVFKINKSEFFKRIPYNNEKLIELVTQKNKFFLNRIMNQAQVLNGKISSSYYTFGGLEGSFSESGDSIRSALPKRKIRKSFLKIQESNEDELKKKCKRSASFERDQVAELTRIKSYAELRKENDQKKEAEKEDQQMYQDTTIYKQTGSIKKSALNEISDLDLDTLILNYHTIKGRRKSIKRVINKSPSGDEQSSHNGSLVPKSATLKKGKSTFSLRMKPTFHRKRSNSINVSRKDSSIRDS